MTTSKKSRDWRRAHRARLIAKRRRYCVVRDDPTPKRLGKIARTATPCSCEMCRNSRWIEGETLAERSFNCEPMETDREW